MEIKSTHKFRASCASGSRMLCKRWKSGCTKLILSLSFPDQMSTRSVGTIMRETGTCRIHFSRFRQHVPCLLWTQRGTNLHCLMSAKTQRQIYTLETWPHQVHFKFPSDILFTTARKEMDVWCLVSAEKKVSLSVMYEAVITCLQHSTAALHSHLHVQPSSFHVFVPAIVAFAATTCGEF